MMQVYPKYKLVSLMDVIAVDVSKPGRIRDKVFIASNNGLNNFTFNWLAYNALPIRAIETANTIKIIIPLTL